MNDHVAKPFDPATLIATVQRWVPRVAAAPVASVARHERDSLPSSLPPFDLAAALDRLDGNESLLRRIIARFAEEFACILPETEPVGTSAVAERIASGIAALAIPHASSPVAPYVTASIGLFNGACEPTLEPHEIVAEGDQRLYRAKAEGRNRIVS